MYIWTPNQVNKKNYNLKKKKEIRVCHLGMSFRIIMNVSDVNLDSHSNAVDMTSVSMTTKFNAPEVSANLVMSQSMEKLLSQIIYIKSNF